MVTDQELKELAGGTLYSFDDLRCAYRRLQDSGIDPTVDTMRHVAQTAAAHGQRRIKVSELFYLP